MRRVFKYLLLLIFLCAGWSTAFGQPNARMRFEDKVRIREAMKIAQLYGEKIWKGMQKVPFAIVLVTDSVEFLINHPAPSSDFNLLEDDTILASKIYYRKTVLDKRLLATFPAVGGFNTIVVGTPENTGKHSTDWIITLLHEHFHQYTYSSPDYYAAVEKLELSGGEQSGMWMLNYPFPYRDSAVMHYYRKYTVALSKTLTSIGTDSFMDNFMEYRNERRSFQEALKPADYRYFSFQVWQEGLARYTEHKFLELLKTYEPSKVVMELADFVSFKKYGKGFYQKQLARITDYKLEKGRRECFYALGFAEGLILDKLNSSWREKYRSERFYVERYSDEFGSQEGK